MRTFIRRLVFTFAALATLLALFYEEEDWRGARALRAAENEYDRRGETLDYTKFFPPPIAAAQNLAALPIFALTKHEDEHDLQPHALQDALDRTYRSYPSPGNFLDGKMPDLPAIQASVKADFSKVFPHDIAPASSAEQLDRLFPFLTELRAESARRPLCRFESKYDTNPPFDRPFALLTQELSVAKLLALHAVLAESEGKGAVALEDLRTLFIVSDGARIDPSLVGKLVDVGMKAIALSPIRDGLALHVWNEAQLAQLQAALEKFNFLVSFRSGFLGEAAHDIPNFDYFKKHPAIFERLMNGSDEADRSWWPELFFEAWPSGWFEQNEARLLEFHLKMIGSIDISLSRFLVDYWRQIDQKTRLDDERVPLPWNMLFRVASRSLPSLVSRFAHAQALIDESILACAMERYRLAQGHYPDNLEALRPEEITTIPHDLINGQPLHYQLLPDGSYRIYSVGMDERDHGGKIVYVPNSSPPRVDQDQGDWVWFGAK